MIKVLFDHQTFSMQYYGGISRYFANIHHAISQSTEVTSDISILRTNNQYIQDFKAPLNNFAGSILLKKQRKAAKWNKIYSKYRIAKNDYNVLHPTYYNPYFLAHTKKPYVITVHDMIHELFPEYFDQGDQFVRYKRLCVESAAHIIAISSSTKEDLKKILGIEDSRISVIHHGYNVQLSSLSNKPAVTNYGDYLLYVGDRRGYKNFARFIIAITPLLIKNPLLKLICTGGGPIQSAEDELLMRLKVADRVEQVSASDHDLSFLYKNALAFIYPSLYEGFGLPILEAFQNDCPVIASDTVCFREIGEDALSYFNPYDEDSILKTIESVIHNTELINMLKIRGRQQLLKFPMDNCMTKTIEVYKNIAG